MSILSRVRILPKILSVIALLAAVTFAIGAIMTRDMTAIGARYAHFLANDATAAANFARLNRTTVDLFYLGYRIVAEQEAAEISKLVPEIDKRIDEARGFLAAIRNEVPRHAGQVDDIDRRFATLGAQFAPVVAAATANDDAKALKLMHEAVEPKLREVLATSRPLRDTVNSEVAAGTVALGGHHRRDHPNGVADHRCFRHHGAPPGGAAGAQWHRAADHRERRGAEGAGRRQVRS